MPRCNHPVEDTSATLYLEVAQDFTAGREAVGADKYIPVRELGYSATCEAYGATRRGRKLSAAPTWVRRALGEG